MNFTPEQLARLAQTPHMDLMLQRGRARQANDNALDLCHFNTPVKMFSSNILSSFLPQEFFFSISAMYRANCSCVITSLLCIWIVLRVQRHASGQ